MRVLVCGGRNYGQGVRGEEERQLLLKTLDDLQMSQPISLLIHGGASGADSLAGDWCVKRGICYIVVPADWVTYGRWAGPKRNQEMLDQYKPDLVVAFPGGNGTTDMVRRAKAAKVQVMKVPKLGETK